MSGSEELGPHVLAVLIDSLRSLKSRAEQAFEQLDDDEFFRQLDDESNSVWVTIKHLSGNMRSRWRDFLTSDGEKPDRHRDNEFVEEIVPRETILQTWEAGWARLFQTLESLTGDDLTQTVYLRHEPRTVLQRLIGELGHYAYHVGHLFTMCKHIRGQRWRYLSIPRGQSEQFNRARGL